MKTATHPYTPRVERLGVLGGTFDPVHIATHRRRGRHARVPSTSIACCSSSPATRGRSAASVVASARDRLMLVEAAVADVDGVEASSIEVERDAASVTADTLEALTAPDRELFLVLGADAVANMSTWRRLDETRDLATIVVVERLGDAHAEPPGDGWKVERVAIPRLDISSTDLRDRLAAGRPIDGMVPPAVVHAIDGARALHWRRDDDPGARLTALAPDASRPGSDRRSSRRRQEGHGDRRARRRRHHLDHRDVRAGQRHEHASGEDDRRGDRARAQDRRTASGRARSRGSATRPGCSWTSAT